MDGRNEAAIRKNQGVEVAGNRTENHFAGNFEAETQIIGAQITGDVHINNAWRGHPPPPIISIPYGRDKHFVERDVLKQILKKCSTSGLRIGLAGKGGAGKSQLAIETCWRIHEQEPKAWVLWAHASSPERLQDSFKRIAQVLGLLQPGQTYDKDEILRLVQSKLSDEQAGRWLLIIDNADDKSAFEQSDESNRDKKSKKTVRIKLPVSQYGTILFTSRTKKVLRSMIDAEEDIFEVHPMTDTEACKLLQRKLPRDVFHEGTARRLVTYLDCMPLAITQAAAFMTEREVSIPDYLRKLRVSRTGGANVLSQDDFHDPRRDGDSSDSILLTWHISFEYIDGEYPTAGQLLGCMSLLNRESIPKDLLDQGQSDDLERDIAVLRSYDFIHRTAEGDSFSMHRLVQMSTQQWLRSNNKVLETTEKLVAALNNSFPDPPEIAGYPSDIWPLCQRLITHLESILTIDRLGTSCDTAIAASAGEVFHRAVLFTAAISDKPKSEKFGYRLYQSRKNILGAQHENTLWAALSLGRTLVDRGKYAPAEDILEKAWLDQQKSSFREPKFECLLIARLGRAVSFQGRVQEAEQPLKKALKVAEMVYGAVDPTVAEIAQNIATVYGVQGRHKESLPYYQQALEIHRSIHGPTDARTLTRCQRLAQAMAYAGQLEDAARLLQTTIEQQSQSIGDLHPNSILSRRILARVLSDQGQMTKSLEVITLTARLSLTAFGPDDLRTKSLNQEAMELTAKAKKLRNTSGKTSPQPGVHNISPPRSPRRSPGHSRSPDPRRYNHQPGQRISPNPDRDRLHPDQAYSNASLDPQALSSSPKDDTLDRRAIPFDLEGPFPYRRRLSPGTDPASLRHAPPRGRQRLEQEVVQY